MSDGSGVGVSGRGTGVSAGRADVGVGNTGVSVGKVGVKVGGTGVGGSGVGGTGVFVAGPDVTVGHGVGHCAPTEAGESDTITSKATANEMARLRKRTVSLLFSKIIYRNPPRLVLVHEKGASFFVFLDLRKLSHGHSF